MQTIYRARQAAMLPAPEMLEIMVIKVGGNEYGIDLAKVRELRSVDVGGPTTDGAIFLRGARVPLVDMRQALAPSMPASEAGGSIVIVNVDGCSMALAVDATLDIVKLTAAQIAPPLAGVGPLDADSQIGIGNADGRQLVLIDIDHFLSGAAATMRDRPLAQG